MLELRANGTIYPSRFIKADTAKKNCVVQATLLSPILGVSQQYTYAKYVSEAGVSSVYTMIKYFTTGENCMLEIAENIRRGSLVCSDALGKGILLSQSGWSGGVALESGVSGQLIRFRCDPRFCSQWQHEFSSAFAIGTEFV